MRVKFGLLEQTQGLHLRAKFHLNALHNAAGKHTQRSEKYNDCTLHQY